MRLSSVHARRLLQQSMSTVSLSMCMLVVYSFCFVLCVCVCVFGRSCLWQMSFHFTTICIITTPHTLPSTRSSSLIPDRLTQCIPDNKCTFCWSFFLSTCTHTLTHAHTLTREVGCFSKTVTLVWILWMSFLIPSLRQRACTTRAASGSPLRPTPSSPYPYSRYV